MRSPRCAPLLLLLLLPPLLLTPRVGDAAVITGAERSFSLESSQVLLEALQRRTLKFDGPFLKCEGPRRIPQVPRVLILQSKSLLPMRPPQKPFEIAWSRAMLVTRTPNVVEACAVLSVSGLRA